MQIPEAVYGFTRPQDLVSQHFEVVRRTATITIGVGNNTDTVKVFTVPNDKALFIGGAWVFFAAIADVNAVPAGVGVALTQIGATFALTDYIAWSTMAAASAGAAGRELGTGGAFNIVVPGGHDVHLTGALSLNTGGGQAGTVGFHGILIPRGNILSA